MVRSTSVLVLFAMMTAPALAVDMTAGANPIRKIVTLMQNMQKEIEAEGAKEKELFDKFMCFCSSSGGDMAKAAADATAKIDELTAQVSSETAEKAQIEQELADHKTDRESAKNDLAESVSLRTKEQGEFEAMKADSDTNIAAMASAIPALEKGMGGAALLQLKGGNTLHKLVQSYPNMDPQDRRDVTAFLEQTETSAGAGQIVGILKAMKDEMEANLKSAVADEQKAVEGFNSLKASKEKEVEVATEAIETKTGRSGQLAVSVVQAADGLEDAQKEAADAEKFAKQLETQCGTKEAEMATRTKARSEEIAAISEAIAILNDDDALDVFKKAIPSALVQTGVGFLQHSTGKASPAKKAQAILAQTAAKYKSAPLRLMLYTLNSKLKLKSKGGFGEVVKMIDDMVVLLGKQQQEDDKQKEWCAGEFDKAADDEAGATTKLAQIDATLSEEADKITQAMEEVSVLTKEIEELDHAVAEATEQRKEEHAQYIETMQMNEVAAGLVGKAKARMAKFYTPGVAAASLISIESFVQVSSHDEFGVAPLQAPETFSGKVQKNEKSSGVLALMDSVIRDLENDSKDGEYEEKTAQADYAELMGDSQASRAQNSKSIVDKNAAKAEAEQKSMSTKEAQASTSQELKLTQNMIKDLHASCDFIMQNHDLRKEARASEVDSLKNAKAVLSGANFGF